MKVPRHILMSLIVACLLLMETMDSHIVATSLPAIAEGLGQHPLSLHLGLTSYLLALAIFIPVSGCALARRRCRAWSWRASLKVSAGP